MQSIIEISWAELAFFSLILLLPIGINYYLKLALAKEIVISSARMTLQLILVGIYLQYLFTLNSLWINFLWLALMALIGTSSIIGKSHLPKKPLFLPVLTGLMVGLIPLLFIILAGLLSPQPVYSAQYLIPLAGMLLGNSLSGNIVALQRLFSSFNDRKMEYEGMLALGATPKQAAFPFIQAAIQQSMAPILASMSTTGLVTLPGMMTGQILAGADPIIAIKYQLVILMAIFVMIIISVTTALLLTTRRLINTSGLILVSPSKS
ncbi:ABC transporter permease [Shewanella surugensis]|uniref:ABC transporter permease n=1 Tax=Shewanella surugensis TaxID=212020 RepID=A0ABT0LDN9_9GAMM|nr:ABC transporter permease [Shewanella surugensis]MCL1125824.1 ABC transporter permease [Shewanella surugensis]